VKRLLTILVLLALAAGCSGSSTESTESTPAAGEQATVPTAAKIEPGEEPVRHLNVLIYYPAADGRGLIGEPHEIFNTIAPGDRAKQILADLITGPNEETGLHALPSGTMLRQVYVLEDGTAYVDFSSDLKHGLRGGSTEEIYTVYSIINSVALNIPEIRRVGLLVDGQPTDTLSGHLDLRRPLAPDPSVILRE
jgi:spore germination protein GerM